VTKSQKTSDVSRDWPACPPGRDTVLHVRVLANPSNNLDRAILWASKSLAPTNYWLAAVYIHRPDDPSFALVQADAKQANCPLIGITDTRLRERGMVRSLLKICQHYNVRIWHGHDYKSNLLGLLLNPLWPMKLVSTVHQPDGESHRASLGSMVNRWCLPNYHHVICESDDLLDHVTKLAVPPQQSTVVHEIIDDKTFSRQYPVSQAPLRVQRDVSPIHTVIGAVGPINRNGSLNHLVRAMQVLCKDKDTPPYAQLWIAGHGDGRDELSCLIDYLGLGDTVKLFTPDTDPHQVLHALDVFVACDVNHELSTQTLQAMALSIPVVATVDPKSHPIIKDGDTCLICTLGQIEMLADTLRTMLTDTLLRDRLAQAGRAWVQIRHSYAHRSAKVKSIYDKLMGQDSQQPTQEHAAVSGVSGGA